MKGRAALFKFTRHALLLSHPRESRFLTGGGPNSSTSLFRFFLKSKDFNSSSSLVNNYRRRCYQPINHDFKQVSDRASQGNVNQNVLLFQKGVGMKSTENSLLCRYFSSKGSQSFSDVKKTTGEESRNASSDNFTNSNETTSATPSDTGFTKVGEFNTSSDSHPPRQDAAFIHTSSNNVKPETSQTSSTSTSNPGRKKIIFPEPEVDIAEAARAEDAARRKARVYLRRRQDMRRLWLKRALLYITGAAFAAGTVGYVFEVDDKQRQFFKHRVPSFVYFVDTYISPKSHAVYNSLLAPVFSLSPLPPSEVEINRRTKRQVVDAIHVPSLEEEVRSLSSSKKDSKGREEGENNIKREGGKIGNESTTAERQLDGPTKPTTTTSTTPTITATTESNNNTPTTATPTTTPIPIVTITSPVTPIAPQKSDALDWEAEISTEVDPVVDSQPIFPKSKSLISDSPNSPSCPNDGVLGLGSIESTAESIPLSSNLEIPYIIERDILNEDGTSSDKIGTSIETSGTSSSAYEEVSSSFSDSSLPSKEINNKDYSRSNKDEMLFNDDKLTSAISPSPSSSVSRPSFSASPPSPSSGVVCLSPPATAIFDSIVDGVDSNNSSDNYIDGNFQLLNTSSATGPTDIEEFNTVNKEDLSQSSLSQSTHPNISSSSSSSFSIDQFNALLNVILSHMTNQQREISRGLEEKFEMRMAEERRLWDEEAENAAVLLEKEIRQTLESEMVKDIELLLLERDGSYLDDKQNSIVEISKIKGEVKALEKTFTSLTESLKTSLDSNRTLRRLIDLEKDIYDNRPIGGGLEEIEQSSPPSSLLSFVFDAVPGTIKHRTRTLPVGSKRDIQRSFESVFDECVLAAFVPKGSGILGHIKAIISRYIYYSDSRLLGSKVVDYIKAPFSRHNLDILQRAAYLCKQGDIYETHRSLQQLSGLPADVCRDWLRDAESFLTISALLEVIRSDVCRAGAIDIK